jgi:transposase
VHAFILAQHNAVRNRQPPAKKARNSQFSPRLISYTTVALVFLLAMDAFALSYNALQGMAADKRLGVSSSTIKRDLAALRSQAILELLQEGLDEQAIATRLELNLETVQADIASLNGRTKESLMKLPVSRAPDETK